MVRFIRIDHEKNDHKFEYIAKRFNSEGRLELNDVEDNYSSEIQRKQVFLSLVGKPYWKDMAEKFEFDIDDSDDELVKEFIRLLFSYKKGD